MRFHHVVLLTILQAIAVCSVTISASQSDPLSLHRSLSSNVTLPINATNKYYVECLGITNPRQPKLITSSCARAISTICRKLSFPQPRLTTRGRWQWTTLPGCSLGYFIPDDAPSTLIPFERECEGDIFGNIIQQCGENPRYNTGTINVDYPPTPMMPGFPITLGYPRYIMAPSELDRTRIS